MVRNKANDKHNHLSDILASFPSLPLPDANIEGTFFDWVLKVGGGYAGPEATLCESEDESTGGYD